ncbi:MAG: VWA domain-containing protein [Pseudobdellovibrionaceae bacterium]
MSQDEDNQALRELFGGDIPSFDENRRKENLNLALAAFEESKKNQKTTQGNGFWARLIGKQPDKRSESMSFTHKKLVYGGLATACCSLMIFAIAPSVVQNSLTRTESGASVNSLALDVSAMPAAKNLTDKDSENVTVSMNQAVVEGRMKADEGRAEAKAKRADIADYRRAAESDAAMPAKKERAVASSEMMAEPSSSVPSPAQMAVGASNGAVMGGLMVMPSAPMPVDELQKQQQDFGRDNFKHVEESPVKQVAQEPVSTFSIDVDTASYSFVRGSLDNGVLPQKDAVRVEEMINYFDYDYPLPTQKAEPFSTNVILKPSPWSNGKQLLTIGIKGYDIPKTEMPNSNIVFLLDVSGSMNEPAKLPLLKQSIAMLLDTLKPTDTVSIVVYAGAAGTVLAPTKVADKVIILNAIQTLQPGGSTAGAEGIRQAYTLAEVNFNKNAVNRVILATDGDFNVGITNPEELKDFVSREKDKGIFLSVLGFGRGNYNDLMMQELAQNGNGIAAYIDNINEGRKVLVDEATKTLFPIAKDVKIQVEFNPATVAEYRLVGYETRALRTEDFNNDKVDAGDIGAGAEVTAIYEVTPKGAKPSVDPSRYAPDKLDEKNMTVSGELAFVKLRYKLPNESESKLITTPVTQAKDEATATAIQETNWAVAVASFAQILKGGTYTGTMTYDDVLRLAENSKGQDPFGYRAEFINLVRKAKTASGLEAQPYGQQNVVPQPVPIYQYPVPETR